jgi:predicted  nucleic acid-binding Zn-ribbon protein
MGVFEGWLGQELLWYTKHYAALQTQVSLLQSQVADLQNQLDTNVQAQTIAALQAKITQAEKDLQA